jgi:hypothetical protein
MKRIKLKIKKPKGAKRCFQCNQYECDCTDIHLGCSAYPNCADFPLGCFWATDGDEDEIGWKD